MEVNDLQRRSSAIRSSDGLTEIMNTLKLRQWPMLETPHSAQTGMQDNSRSHVGAGAGGRGRGGSTIGILALIEFQLV